MHISDFNKYFDRDEEVPKNKSKNGKIVQKSTVKLGLELSSQVQRGWIINLIRS